MPLRDGKEFTLAKPDEVVDWLRGRPVTAFQCAVRSLTVHAEGDELLLIHKNGLIRAFPLRRSFALKLLRWYDMPQRLEEILTAKTLAALLTDLLRGIRSGDVTVHLEGEDALTITSRRYNLIRDLDVIKCCGPLGIDAITRDDFRLRVYMKITDKTEPVPGDVCGFGYNAFNSETGFCALSISHFVLRYVCSNGAIANVGESVRRVHYGHKEGTLHAFLKERIERMRESRVTLERALRSSVDQPAGERFTEAKKRLSNLIGHGRTSDALAEFGPSSPVYSLFNAITAEARSGSAESRARLESLAGDLLVGTLSASNPTVAGPQRDAVGQWS
jgi:hypothetical protein